MKQHLPGLNKLIIIALLFVASCENNSTKGNFVVTTPERWTREDTVSEDGSKRVEFTAPPKYNYSGFIENISVSIVHYNNLDSYIDGVIEDVKRSAVFYEEMGRGEIKINGLRAKWVQIHVLFAKASDDAKKEQKVYFVKDKRNIYMIVCSARKNGISALQSKIDEVINSFKIISEKK